MPKRSSARSRKRGRAGRTSGSRSGAELVTGGKFVAPMNLIHRFVRMCDSGDLNVSNGTSSAGATINVANAGIMTLSTGAAAGVSYYGLAVAFELADLPAVSELTTLYDQYRIHHVELEMVPFNTLSPTVGSAGGNGNLACLVHSVLDWDDATAPAASTSGIQALQQYRGYRLDNLYAPAQNRLKWSVVPRPALAGYAGAFTSYVSTAPLWTDCNSANVQHYGIKFIFEVLNTAAVNSFVDVRWNLKYYVEMRMAR